MIGPANTPTANIVEITVTLNHSTVVTIMVDVTEVADGIRTIVSRYAGRPTHISISTHPNRLTLCGGISERFGTMSS